MSAATTARRAARQRLRTARTLSQQLDGERVRFDVVTRIPGAREHRIGIGSTSFLRRTLADVAAQLSQDAQRDRAAFDGATVTVVAKLPRKTDRGGTTWEPVNLCAYLYHRGRWWHSRDGMSWEPVPGIVPSPADPAAPALAGEEATRAPA